MKTAMETIFVGKQRLFNRLPADVQPLARRAGRLHAGNGMGEGASREPRHPDRHRAFRPAGMPSPCRADREARRDQARAPLLNKFTLGGDFWLMVKPASGALGACFPLAFAKRLLRDARTVSR
jgi:hypothetical protein